MPAKPVHAHDSVPVAAEKGSTQGEGVRSGVRSHSRGSERTQAILSGQPSITFTMPHPPASLSPNGRVHWRVRARDAAQVRRDAALLVRQAIWEAGDVGHPWPGAVMDIQWQFAGIQPDADNVIARLKAAIDGIADACLIENDRTIRIGAVTFERVSRADRCVVITLTKED